MEAIWKTKEGKEIKICDMETSHIENSINMMKRKGFVNREEYLEIVSSYPVMNGDMAQYCAEQEYENWLASHMPSKILGELEKELEKRTVVCSQAMPDDIKPS